VTFTAPASGASAFFAGANSETVTTDSRGVATSSIPVANSTEGTYSVVVSSATAPSQAVTLTNNQAGPSPSPTATATPTATVSPTGPTSRRFVSLFLTSPATITPGVRSTWSGAGTPGQSVTLRCYSRTPENSQPGSGTPTYFDARSDVITSQGSVAFSLNPGTNTRCFLKYSNAADSDVTTSNSVVQNVATALSLSAYRDGVRRYHFQGTNLPRRSGQLITLYRYATGPNLDQYCVPTSESDTFAKDDGSCHAIITSQAKTGPNNTWRIDRVFKGSGQFYFVVRTSENINNGRGHSNQRLTIIH
jgi:hypothetical protein